MRLSRQSRAVKIPFTLSADEHRIRAKAKSRGTGEHFETMVPYAWHGSWAVWGSWGATPPFDRHGNLRFPLHATQHLDRLHGRAVIIGLNPAGDGQPPVRIPGGEWANFHTPGKHNATSLPQRFTEHGYGGAT